MGEPQPHCWVWSHTRSSCSRLKTDTNTELGSGGGNITHMTTVDMSHLHQIGGFQVCKSLTSHYQTIAGLLRHECMRHSLYCIVDPRVSQTACKVTGGGGSVIHIAVTPQTSWTQPRPVIRVSEIIGACVHSIYNSAADSGEVTADCWEEQPWLTFPGSPPKLSSRRKGLCNIRILC